MTMASIAQPELYPFVKQCANCSSYKWPQPENIDSNKRCARCKILHYCSKECQTEHWLKVHKNHCKYLSGSKVLKESSHDPNSCRFCQNEINVAIQR